jgi:hypothetical protein
MGRILECLLNDEVGISVSSRGDGEVRSIRHEEFGEAQEVIPESYQFETFDAVLDPSVDVDVRRLGESQVMAGAVHKILESKESNLTESDITCFQTLLESLQPQSRSANPVAVSRLRETANSILSATQLREDPMNTAELEVANKALAGQVATLQGQLEASKKLHTAMQVEATNARMRAEHMESLFAEEKRQRLEAEEIVASMTEADSGFDVEETPEYQELKTQQEDTQKDLEAAEKLVEELTTTISNQKLTEHKVVLTEGLSEAQVVKVKPFLDRCTTVEELDSTMKDLKPLIESTGGASLATLTPRNPIESITEDRDKNKSGPQLTGTQEKSQQLVEAMKERRKAEAKK